MLSDEFPLNEHYLNHDVSLDEQQYRDSSSVLLNLDCLAGLKLLKDESVHLCLTDPPYNLGNFMKGRNTGVFRLRENHFVASGWDDLAYEDWYVQMLDFLQLTYSKLAPNGAVIIFMSIIKVESIIEIAQKAGFYYKTTGIWHKTNPMPRNMNLTFVNSTEAWVYLIKKALLGLLTIMANYYTILLKLALHQNLKRNLESIQLRSPKTYPTFRRSFIKPK